MRNFKRWFGEAVVADKLAARRKHLLDTLASSITAAFKMPINTLKVPLDAFIAKIGMKNFNLLRDNGLLVIEDEKVGNRPTEMVRFRTKQTCAECGIERSLLAPVCSVCNGTQALEDKK